MAMHLSYKEQSDIGVAVGETLAYNNTFVERFVRENRPADLVRELKRQGFELRRIPEQKKRGRGR